MPHIYLLHRNDLDEFLAYLDRTGVAHRSGRGMYQVAQVKQGKGWMPIYYREHDGGYLSVPDPLVPTARSFLSEREAKRTKKRPDPLVVLNSEEAVTEVLARFHDLGAVKLEVGERNTYYVFFKGEEDLGSMRISDRPCPGREKARWNVWTDGKEHDFTERHRSGGPSFHVMATTEGLDKIEEELRSGFDWWSGGGYNPSTG